MPDSWDCSVSELAVTTSFTADPRERLDDILRGLSDERCHAPGAAPTGPFLGDAVSCRSDLSLGTAGREKVGPRPGGAAPMGT
jgi:hypothetical protein